MIQRDPPTPIDELKCRRECNPAIDYSSLRHEFEVPTRRERLAAWLKRAPRRLWSLWKSDASLFFSAFWLGVLTGIPVGIMLMAWAAGRWPR